MSLSIFVIGGHGKVALSFTRQAAARGHRIISMIRQPEHASDLPAGTTADAVQPVVASLESASVDDLAHLFQTHQPDIILFAAGAGGKGGADRTTAVDHHGAVKTFDAIQQSGIANANPRFRRFLLVSAVDVRDKNKPPPAWYSDEDIAISNRMRSVIGPYMDAKYEADKDLSRRTGFPWTVLRPGGLSDDPGTGKVALAQHQTLVNKIPRDDVAAVLLELAELPRGQGDSLMLDLLSGNNDVATAVKQAIERGRSDFEG
ncbi:uncharacterized protein PFL1_02249 [Pseudozyma flocculosa PF-1]|uniref:uncharacterized protein n=1 Tax=Pseudozyma flocculosa PF-1 TaxID=1277687 RepID=UPI000456173A|nr:uncharacterized protein PFL1_02249 [Pseudozyma flocculosa PF-1]EPQ30132.1 hypothetical protein PFL1_02249 [Pseudozyma flocculosa PF-1]